MNTFATNRVIIGTRIVLKIWYVHGGIGRRYFSPDDRFNLRRTLKRVKPYKEMAVRDSPQIEAKVEAELRKGYYDMDKYLKYFSNEPH